MYEEKILAVDVSIWLRQLSRLSSRLGGPFVPSLHCRTSIHLIDLTSGSRVRKISSGHASTINGMA
jgi:hypothetical protein